MNEKLPVFGYMRVSGLSQAGADKDGFVRQEEAIRAACERAGYELRHVYKEEGVSGKTDEADRPAFSEMVGAILGNGVKTIVVENLSRLAREYRIQEHLLLYLASRNISLIAADTGENITEAIKGDPMKKAIVQIQGIFYELERAMLVQKLTVARKRKLASGEIIDGSSPYGAKPGEKEVISRMIEHRKNGYSFKEIAHLLNAENAVSRYGKKWHTTSVFRVLSRQNILREVSASHSPPVA